MASSHQEKKERKEKDSYWIENEIGLLANALPCVKTSSVQKIIVTELAEEIVK